jgi:signal transduction histidine kinase
MRRELKLVFLVLVLIVGPSATLSFLAGRVLGSWQIVLRERMARDADRALDAVVVEWVSNLDALRKQMGTRLLPRLVPRSNFFQATLSVAEIKARHEWVGEVFVAQRDGALLYPVMATNRAGDFWAMDSSDQAGLTALRQSGQQTHSLTNAEATIAVYRRLLDVPGLDPVVRAMALLRLAQGYREAKMWENVIESLHACVEIAESNSKRYGLISVPLRDPEEGFHLDLIGLAEISDIYAVTGNKTAEASMQREIRTRVLERYDFLPSTQRALLATRMEERDREGMASDIQWQECVRAQRLVKSDRDRIERDFGGISRGLVDDGWQWLRFGTNDYLVTIPDRNVSGAVWAVVQFRRQALSEKVIALAQAEGRKAGVRVSCGVQESVGHSSSNRLTLAERRLAPPLDRFVITAMPADPRSFAANAAFQKRLYGLAGALLMIGVIVGGWLMWREAAWEIHRAREHSDFAAAVSHDLRTPLSSMRMLAESLYLERVQDEAKRKKFLGAILKESDRLSRLTDRALYFIRYGEGMLRYRFTEGDLGGVVQETVETFATGIGASVVRLPTGKMDGGNEGVGIIDQKEAKPVWVIQLRVEPELGPVLLDAGAIEQVVFNLLDNAVKYSGHAHVIEVDVRRYVHPAGVVGYGHGLTQSWWFRGRGTRVNVEVAIRDHGVGMSKDDVRRIVRPYTRGRKAAEANAHGIGLGLALCRHVVQAHKGRLEIVSGVGEGSTFKVILPAGRASQEGE